MKRAIIFGGYGTFGLQIAGELARRGVPLTIVGRNRARAEKFAASLSGQVAGQVDSLVADVTKFNDCLNALSSASIAINSAGPYSKLGRALLDACLERGVDYADIADDRAFTAIVRGYHEQFRARGVAAVYGCSSLPSISGALALCAQQGVRETPRHVRVTLFIGNNNPKGDAAISSAVTVLGKSIAAPQGLITGFHDGELVSLPPPFGRRRVYNFESPEYDLFPQLLNVNSVTVKVGFELRLATWGFALLARWWNRYGDLTAKLLSIVGKLGRWYGHSGGTVCSELFYPDGKVRRAILSSPENSQRMAAMPCILAAAALTRGEVRKSGVMTCYELLGAEQLLNGIKAAGYDYSIEEVVSSQ